jgi:hypothetical protein
MWSGKRPGDFATMCSLRRPVQSQMEFQTFSEELLEFWWGGDFGYNAPFRVRCGVDIICWREFCQESATVTVFCVSSGCETTSFEQWKFRHFVAAISLKPVSKHWINYMLLLSLNYSGVDFKLKSPMQKATKIIPYLLITFYSFIFASQKSIRCCRVRWRSTGTDRLL